MIHAIPLIYGLINFETTFNFTAQIISNELFTSAGIKPNELKSLLCSWRRPM